MLHSTTACQTTTRNDRIGLSFNLSHQAVFFLHSSIIISQATSTEIIEQCADIWLASSVKAHPFIPEEFWQAHREVMIKTYLPQSELYVVFNKNIPVAFSACCQNMLAALFVHPMHWRKGIGKKLLSILFLKHTQLELSVYQENRNAILFYQRSGFIKTAERACQHTGKIEDIMQWHA